MTPRTTPSIHGPQAMQKTLVNTVCCEGIGVHSGEKITLEIMPAPENYGICFERTDLVHSDNKIQALWSSVTATDLCTQISNAQGAVVSTIEHLMAALAALEIDNVHILVNAQKSPLWMVVLNLL